MVENNEQNKNLNPQAEGSNVASGNKNKGKEVKRISEVEINQQINKINNLIQTNNKVFLNTEKIKEKTKSELERKQEQKNEKAARHSRYYSRYLPKKIAYKTIDRFGKTFNENYKTLDINPLTTDEILETHKDIILREQNQLAHELQASKQVLIKVCEMVKDEREENEAKISELNDTIKKGNKQLEKVEQEKENEKLKTIEISEKAETELDKLKKEIETLTQQLAAITKTYNEETLERQKLEQIITETAERINNNSLLPDLTKIELHEAKEKIASLSQTIEAQRGIITVGKISLESRERKIED
jgi:chromosome segregation ATPase